jgi:CheY-like chemotaxis protein/anti-sigma regulatory factor (Ser/Thr protein kinase)
VHRLSVLMTDRPVLVHGDGPRLRQVLANLIDNACKYTPAGGRVEVELQEDDRQATIAVRDSGIGIAEHMVERIFRPFEQGEVGTETSEGGLGLGLALVHQLVALHGGTVRVSSGGEGKGSTFIVELPARDRRPAILPEGSDEVESVPVTTRTEKRVLIVDDNADAAELLADRLRMAGYTVELAFDGKGGLASARQARCHVALIDLGLPDLDGFEVCRALKGEQPALRVVALTGYSDSRSRDRAQEAGFDGFLVKPLDARKVVAAVEELIVSLES